MTSLFRNRHFMALWIGQIVSSVGDYFYWLAMPLAVRRLTGSTAAMGVSMIALALPNLLGPLAGVMVDRWDRRWTMIASDLTRAAIVLLSLLAHSRETVWIFFLVGFLLSVFSQFFSPARDAALPLIVKEEELLSANGLMQTTMTAALIIGPGLAGVIIQQYGLSVAFIVDSVSFVVSALTIGWITVPHTTVARSKGAAAVWSELKEGLHFLFTNRTLVGLLIALSIVQLGTGALQVIWIPFLQTHFGIGPAGLGLVDGVHGVGMVVGGLSLGLLLSRFKKVAISAAGLLFGGLAIGMMGQARAFWWVLLWIGLLGVVVPAISASLGTIMQMVVPDLKRGRVGGATNAIITVSSILSMQAAGMLGQRVNLRWIYAGGGLLVFLSGFLTLILVKEPGATPDPTSQVPGSSQGAGEIPAPTPTELVPGSAVE